MNITIIGSGNSGLIHAAKLLEKKQHVGILKSSSLGNVGFFDKIRKEGEYQVVDETNGGRRFVVKPEFITNDAEKAVTFADLIFVMTTTNQHENVARMIAPYMRDGQIVVIVPGYMGSLIFKRHIKKKVVYAEWETTAFNGRIMDSSYVHITFYNPRNAVSVLPQAKRDDVLEILSTLLDNTQYSRANILESALHNPNMIVHPIGILFSASRIEYSKGEFWMYKEGYTDSVVRVIESFDKAKNQILEKIGCKPLGYFEAAKWRNEKDLSVSAMQSFREFAECSNKGPAKIDCRYITEDVPMGLGLFVSIGKVLGVDVSIQESLITLTSALTGKDLRKDARTIQYLLQKEEVTFEDIINAIKE
ncbi:MAG: NAD/NADP octopine/nopaline dehydrogenase family protein [Prevotella sp.]|nr:NAD/NADP octopine/nopaline dehydrogenase family protein [Prevotella sp.]